MDTIAALRGGAYPALQLLALFGVCDGEVVRHVGEPDAVRLLPGVRLFGLLHLDVVGHDGVVVQLGAVLQVAGERLGLLGVAQVDHVQGKAVLGLALLGALPVLDLNRCEAPMESARSSLVIVVLFAHIAHELGVLPGQHHPRKASF
ncbi:hypothetical protein EYF80_022026 [Liparis tanakae]|uniref:Uncharacterized protein n=1 Tax=Liparis tanakae TaxID=230148 RepID=A0A4Z2HQ24_9TELE|nr:hypothetical protein EYF80_022026 [Liparis tanakae]